jgi:hypothetical protein
MVHANETIFGNDADESNFYEGCKTVYVVGVGAEHAFTPGYRVKANIFLLTDLALKGAPLERSRSTAIRTISKRSGASISFAPGLTVYSKAPDADDSP